MAVYATAEVPMKAPWLALALAGVIAAPAAAQHEVARRSFNFFDNTLTIQVLSESSESLRIVRGEEGRLDVAARHPTVSQR
jgi:hypothetical protein